MENTTQKRTLEVIAAEMEVAKNKRDECLNRHSDYQNERALIFQNELASLRNEYALLELSNTISIGLENLRSGLIERY